MSWVFSHPWAHTCALQSADLPWVSWLRVNDSLFIRIKAWVGLEVIASHVWVLKIIFPLVLLSIFIYICCTIQSASYSWCFSSSTVKLTRITAVACACVTVRSLVRYQISSFYLYKIYFLYPDLQILERMMVRQRRSMNCFLLKNNS